MDILDFPLANFLGISESNKEDTLLEIPFNEALTNHVNTYHASVLYTLAEMSSGHFLLNHFPKESVTTYPLVRRSKMKYSAVPKNDKLFTRGCLINQDVPLVKNQLEQTGKVIINIQIDIFDIAHNLIGRGQFEWFVKSKSESLKISQTASLIEK